MESDQSTDKQDPKLIGNTNIAEILLNNTPATPVLYTGSCVSVIAESFYKQNISHIDIQSVGNILNIECADGQSLPDIGYIEVNFKLRLAYLKQNQLYLYVFFL